MLPTFLQNSTLLEAFETVSQTNEEIKCIEFDGTFTKNSNFLTIDFLLFFQRLTLKIGREKKDPSKEKRGHRTSKIVKSMQSYSNGHLSYHCSFYYLARALVACEFAWAVWVRRNNYGRERSKAWFKVYFNVKQWFNIIFF